MTATGEIWFLTGQPGPLRARDARAGRAPVAGDRRPARRRAVEPLASVVWKPVLTNSAAIRRACLDANSDDRCLGVITWMHTFSPAKMWIHGLDELRKPLLHLHTQANEALPWSTIDMDFMNLNQAAHGDREFAHVQTRLGVARKTVAGHVSDPEVTRRVMTWISAAIGRASAAQPAPGALRRQHAQRRRHRRRQGRGGASLRRVRQHVRGQRSRGVRRRRCRCRRRRGRDGVPGHLRRRARAAPGR